MTYRQIEDRELARWKAANPWILLNVKSVGTACGRYPTLDAAKEAVRRDYHAETLEVRGNQVLFAPVYH